MEKGGLFLLKVSEKGVLLSLENTDRLPNARINRPSVHRTAASTFKQCFGPGLHKRFLTNEKKVLSSPGLAPINKCITYSS